MAQPAYPKKRLFLILSIILTITLMISAFQPGPAGESAVADEVIYVDDTATGANDGSSWADAYTDLQDALAAATAGTQIQVAAGLYLPGTQPEDSFQLKNGVELLGSYPDGGETSERSFSHYTILSGDLGGDDTTNENGVVTDPDDIVGQNAYHVVTGSGVDSSAVLDGFYITAGQANGSAPHDSGGGMFTSNGSPVVKNIIFIGNIAEEDGGGMQNEAGSDPSLTNVYIHNNRAGQFGGGLSNDESTPTLISVDFVNNHAGNAGGGLFNRRSDVLLTNVNFTANSAISGGGINNYFSDPSLVNVTLAVNRASSTGGGVHNFHYSDASIDNSILWGNSPDQISQFDDPSVGDSSATIRDSLVQGGCVALATCSGLLTGDPLFVRDPGPGPDGEWGTTDDDANGDTRLKEGSPAINAGDNDHLPPDSFDLDDDGDTSEAIPYDFFFDPRIYGGVVDLGALEAQHKIEITQMIYVDDTATGANDGSSWADAYTDLQDGLAAATPGTQIQVAAGLYLPGTQVEDTFQLKSGVALLGNYPDGGGEESERSFDHPSVLSGDLAEDDNTNADGVVTDPDDIVGENANHVVTGSGVDSSAVLDGFYITAGKANGSAPHYYGGGMYNASGSPALTNVTFSGNYASVGGGMYNLSSSPTLIDVTLSNNEGNNSGGGMYNDNSNPVLMNVVLSGNHAILQGGGMVNSESNSLLTNVTLTANRASDGGGMYNSSSSPMLTNVTVSGNRGGDGGGMFNVVSGPIVRNSILWNNQDAFGNATKDTNIYNLGVGSVISLTHSLVQGTGGSDSWTSDPNFVNGGNNLDTDPLFILDPDPSTTPITSGDLRLGAGSPAINAGNNALLPTDSEDLDDDGITNEAIPFDIANNPRVYGGVVDMGAYEVQEVEITQYFYVDDTATGANDGSSWADAYTDLQDALTAATPGTQIQVAAGLYLPGTQVEDTFQLKGGVELLGNFPDGGGEASERSFEHPSVLSGDLDGDDTSDADGVVRDPDNIAGENAYHVLTANSVDESAIMDGFVVTAGKAHSTWPADSGAGMISFGGSPYLRNIRFTGNTAIAGGGGMRNESSDSTLVNVSFYNNYAGNAGGGMYNARSNSNLINVDFTNNQTEVAGGGMLNQNSDPLLINVSFSNNHAGDHGGGMGNDHSDPLLTNVIFSANTAKWGAGVFNDVSDPRLINVTLASNHADTGGGGVDNYNDSHPSIDNSILWGNSPDQVFEQDTSSATIQDSLVQGGCPSKATCSGTLLTGDPLFVRDPDPGADGDWGTSDDDYGDLQLKVSSPAINAGNNALLPADSWDLDEDGDTSERIPYDYAYNPRITDTTVDMGAMEATETIYKVYLPLTVR